MTDRNPTGPTPGPDQQPPPPATGNGKTKRKHRRKTTAADPEALAKLDFESASGFALAQRITTALASGNMVPEAFRGPAGSPGWANAFSALWRAHLLRLDPFVVMQNITFIDGRPGWLGKFLIALVEAGGKFRDKGWEWKGAQGSDEYGARMVVTRVADGLRCEGQWVDVRLAKAEGWWSKKDRNGREWSKWPTMTAQMLVYRSASFWTNQWNPAATLGLQSVDELLDIARDDQRLIAPPPTAPPTAPVPTPTLVAFVPEPVEDAPTAKALPEGEPEGLQLIRSLLARGERRAAVEAVKRLPADLQKAGMDLYTRETRDLP